MSFKSKSQLRACFAKKARGEADGWNCEKWAHETDNIKKLPEKKKRSFKEFVEAKELVENAIWHDTKEKLPNKIYLYLLEGHKSGSISGKPCSLEEITQEFSEADSKDLLKALDILMKQGAVTTQNHQGTMLYQAHASHVKR